MRSEIMTKISKPYFSGLITAFLVFWANRAWRFTKNQDAEPEVLVFFQVKLVSFYNKVVRAPANI